MANKNTSNARNRDERGVALVTALLLLSLFTVMTLSMVIATTSDTLIDGYYRNARGSFYASDSGINSARQYLINQFQAAVPNPYTPLSGVVPITAGTEQTTVRALETAFGSYNSVLGTQTASWPGTFEITYDTSCDTTGGNTSGGAPCPTFVVAATPPCTAHYKLAAIHATPPSTNVPTCTSLGSSDYVMDFYTYNYAYKLTVSGQSRSGEKNAIEEQGTIQATIQVNTNTNQAFAAWGMFIDQSPICSGSTLVPGTISGPVFTNGAWNFGTGGSYIFTDPIGSQNPNFGYQFGSCDQSANASDTSGSQTINPTFRGGYHLNQPAIALPTDSFSQERAVLDGMGTNLTQPTSTDLGNALKNVSDSAYSGSNGVYLPYSDTATTATCSVAPCMNGGGIFVQGNADSVTLSTSSATISSIVHKYQVFAIKQGTKTTTITVDVTGPNPTTTISDGTTTKTINDVPRNLDVSPSTEAALLYVNGNLGSGTGSSATGLSGPSSGPAIQDGSAVDVVSAGGITITGNILYNTEPVTLPADTLVTSPSTPTSVLGIFTAGGNVDMEVPSSGQNLEIDASIATIQNGGSWGLVNNGNSINTLTIVGGRIQNTLQNINTSTRNVWFDRRFAQGGFAPPFFPSTTVNTVVASTDPTVTAARTTWVNTSAQ